MKAAGLLLELVRNGTQVWVEGDEVRLRGAKGSVTPALREEIVRRKREIISLAKEQTKYALPSFAQQRMWLLDRLEPDTPTYNISDAMRLSGTLHVGALQRSLTEIVSRHEALRTRFEMVDGEPVQVIEAPTAMNIKLLLEDLSGLPPHEREAQAMQLAREEARQPFDLQRGPLMRTKLVRLSEEEHLLLLTMHHIVSDGWSMGVFWRELKSLYGAFSEGRPSPLEELPIQYADYAVWQRRWLRGEVLEEQLGYWKEQLAELPTLDLATDHPRPAVQTHRGARQTLVLSRSLTEALKELARREGMTLFMVLLGVFQVLLSRYAGQEDVAVGTPIAGRNRSETEGLIGFFVNTLVMRTDLSGDPSYKELLSRVREVCLGAYDHQDLPFEKLVEELRPERDLSRTPLFQVFFNMRDRSAPSRELSGLTAEPIPRSQLADQLWLKFDLTLHVSEEHKGLRLRLVYNTDLFDEATIARMLGHFRTLLEGIAADPERPTSDVVLEGLPLTPDSQGDRRTLSAAPEVSRSVLEGGFVAPRTPTEEQLAGIWEEVLGLKRVGVHDDFFELGGHSLLATRVISRVQDVFGVELPLISLFEEPTVSGLALAITQGKVEDMDPQEIDRLLAELDGRS